MNAYLSSSENRKPATMVNVVKVNSLGKTVSKRKSYYWTRKLKKIKLDDLESVCAFSSGGYSCVSLVHLKGKPNSAFALKMIPKSRIRDPAERQMILSEKKILSEVQSDFIVKLYRTFKNEKYLYFLMEFCPGGELFDRGPLSEGAAKFYIACVAEAIDCLHERNFSYNDLKPENLVLDVDGYVKLIDFGFAEKLEPGEKSRYSSWGTAEYFPPEVARVVLEIDKDRGKDRAVDLWALGILLYEFLRGKTPFEMDNDGESCDNTEDNTYNSTLLNITRGIEPVEFPRAYFSEEVEDLIRQLCAYEPSRRLGYGSVEEIREHRWFDNFDWSLLRSRKLIPPFVPELDSVLDTKYFRFETDRNPECNVEEDESDWDVDF